ncbi:toxin glutamine deamidase domain-containing protein [Actinacidiphila acidipaludis]|uniref:Tox-PL domain-containing protein n=1 Tax=Actinacidiphila acidipaludis TaxID=2873382 RepID=A0ABS7QJF9_9ACTN|nr:toxin glutamine deamidase domain-containing protein [Streptomyces acidipaludis]MBY8883113.1 hypothetical protein [Streptomyces acidipaludis]
MPSRSAQEAPAPVPHHPAPAPSTTGARRTDVPSAVNSAFQQAVHPEDRDASPISEQDYLGFVSHSVGSDRGLAFVVNMMVGYRGLDSLGTVLNRVTEGLQGFHGKVAFVVGVNAPEGEVAELRQALAAAQPVVDGLHVPVALVPATFRGAFPYGQMRNDVLHSPQTRGLVKAFMRNGDHPYVSVQDFDDSSRRVPSGAHVFDHVAGLLADQGDGSDAGSVHGSDSGDEEMDTSPRPIRPLMVAGGYRVPDAPDMGDLVQRIDARFTQPGPGTDDVMDTDDVPGPSRHGVPEQWSDPEQRADFLDRLDRAIQADMADREQQALIHPLLPYAPEPNLFVDGPATLLDTAQGPRLRFGEGQAEFTRLAQDLNRLNAWELGRRYEPQLQGLPHTVDVPTTRVPGASGHLPRSQEEIVQQARGDAENGRLPERGLAFVTDYREGATVTDVSRLAHDLLTKGKLAQEGLANHLGRYFNNDLGSNPRGAKKGLKLSDYRRTYRPGDQNTYTAEEFLRPHGPEVGAATTELPKKKADVLGGKKVNVMTQALSAPLDGPFSGIRAGIADEHRVYGAQALALSTPEIRLGRRLAMVQFDPAAGAPPARSLYGQVASALSPAGGGRAANGGPSAGDVRSRTLQWALDTGNLRALADQAAHGGDVESLFHAMATGSSRNGFTALTPPQLTAARAIASALDRPLVLHTPTGDVTADPLPTGLRAVDAPPPGPPLHVDLTRPPGHAQVTTTGGTGGGKRRAEDPEPAVDERPPAGLRPHEEEGGASHQAERDEPPAKRQRRVYRTGVLGSEDAARGALPDPVPGFAPVRAFSLDGAYLPATPEEHAALLAAVPRDAAGEPLPFADPRAYLPRINAAGPGHDPGRGVNCVDASMAFHATWHGSPQVAGSRTVPAGEPDSPYSGVHRLQEWANGLMEPMGYGTVALAGVADRLVRAGHGSAALVRTSQGSDGHAVNVVNWNGEILYIDPQSAAWSTTPSGIAPTDAIHAIALGPDNQLLPGPVTVSDGPAEGASPLSPGGDVQMADAPPTREPSPVPQDVQAPGLRPRDLPADGSPAGTGPSAVNGAHAVEPSDGAAAHHLPDEDVEMASGEDGPTPPPSPAAGPAAPEPRPGSRIDLTSRPGSPMDLDSRPGSPLRPGSPIAHETRPATPMDLDALPADSPVQDSRPGSPEPQPDAPGVPAPRHDTTAAVSHHDTPPAAHHGIGRPGPTVTGALRPDVPTVANPAFHRAVPGGPAQPLTEDGYLDFVSRSVGGDRDLAFVVNAVVGHRNLGDLPAVLQRMTAGLRGYGHSDVAFVIGVNAPEDEVAALREAMAAARPVIEGFPAPVALVGSTFRGSFPYGRMRNDVLHSPHTRALVSWFMGRDRHPYVSVQDFDDSSRLVPSGDHVFDHFAGLLAGQGDGSDAGSAHGSATDDDEMSDSPRPLRPLMMAGGYRVPDAPDMGDLVQRIDARFTRPAQDGDEDMVAYGDDAMDTDDAPGPSRPGVPEQWSDPEQRAEFLDRLDRAIQADMADREQQALIHPLLPYAPEPNLFIDGPATLLDTAQGPRLRFGEGQAEFARLAQDLNRLNAWELGRRYQPQLQDLPDTVDVPATRAPGSGPAHLPQSREEIVQQARGDAENGRLPERGLAFVTDYREGATVTDVSRLAHDLLTKNKLPQQGLANHIGRYFNNDLGSNPRGAKKGVKLGPYRSAYRPGDAGTFQSEEFLRPHGGDLGPATTQLPKKSAEILGGKRVNVASHAVSAPLDGPFSGIRAGIAEEHRVYGAQALALSTPEIRLGRHLALLRFGPPQAAPAAGSLYGHVARTLAGTLDAPSATQVRERAVDWALDIGNLGTLAERLAAAGGEVEPLFHAMASGARPDSPAGALAARVIASALGRPLVLRTAAGDVTVDPLPGTADEDAPPPGPPLRIDLTPPPGRGPSATGGRGPGERALFGGPVRASAETVPEPAAGSGPEPAVGPGAEPVPGPGPEPFGGQGPEPSSVSDQVLAILTGEDQDVITTPEAGR